MGKEFELGFIAAEMLLLLVDYSQVETTYRRVPPCGELEAEERLISKFA